MKEKFYSIKQNSGRLETDKSFRVSKRTLLNREKRHRSLSAARQLLSHTAALAGGRSIREQILPASPRRYYGMTEGLTWLCSSDRSNLRQRVEAWPQIQRNAVFSAD